MNDKDVIRDFERVPLGVVKRASAFAAAILADVAGRRGTLDGRIAPLSPSMRVAGPAFTVEVRPGDNLMIHAAMTMAKPGDVLVIDGKGDRTCALMGSIMVSACRRLGRAGVVLDAAVRDTEELRAIGFPVYSVGANPNGPTKVVPGRIQAPNSAPRSIALVGLGTGGAQIARQLATAKPANVEVHVLAKSAAGPNAVAAIQALGGDLQRSLAGSDMIFIVARPGDDVSLAAVVARIAHNNNHPVTALCIVEPGGSGAGDDGTLRTLRESVEMLVVVSDTSYVPAMVSALGT